MNFLYFLLVGMVAGWLAGKISQGKGFGLLGNLLLGVIGAFVGGLLFSIVGLEEESILGEIISATVGALVVLFIAGKFAARS